MRLFAAVTPSATALRHLAEHVRPVKDTGLRWSDAANWHVTVAFYGEVDDKKVPDLTARVARAAGRSRPMTLRLSGSGRFGAAVLWIGVHGDVEPLRRLAASAVAAGRRVGIERDPPRRFRPHVTVARSKGQSDLRPYVASLDTYDGPPWLATHLTLVRSHLGGSHRQQAVHEPLENFPLGPGSSPA
ncbi:RNA 2',3'-cyclic phosphodiesterase [Phytoactinopolyspora mesophila]|uniref:RNA 2',3'-cyclic phosphodiesterase n=1 Tax=Phytoactinopolyspora mesophila TaxID=2650750 RepID=A0A7K3M4F2_9ACTN|nr:RNA 2',3'-cyclic phosphodiesterase [Phytoactinopolyspora mesophila]NDL58201.1 RNA 2',3'-cyclic phosphodiesterase [Phytoactinopolyspora mesophila]